MFRFEQLDIWKLAIDYGNKLYDIAKDFPKEEIFGLGDQLRRAAVSISNNIAEGCGDTDKGFIAFLNISVKSSLETVNILHFAQKRGYVSETVKNELYVEAEILIKKIRAFKNSIRNKPFATS